MRDIIKHQGVVEKINNSHIVVRIVQTSACSSCGAKNLCNASESKEKLIDVFNVEESYQIGDRVVVCGTTSMGMQAVLLAFGLPVLLVLVTLFVAMHLTGSNTLISAILGMLVVLPYYFVIYLCRDKLNKNFSFFIENNKY